MEIRRIASIFGVNNVIDVKELKIGHINRTFLLDCPHGRYILQSLNREIFKNPKIISENTDMIVKVFSENPDCGVSVPDFLRSDGRIYIEVNSKVWRMYRYIEPLSEYSPYLHGFAAGRFFRVINSGDFKLQIPRKLHEVDLPLPIRNVHGDTKADNIIFGKTPAVIDLDTASRDYAFVDFGDMLRSVTSDGFDMHDIQEAVNGFAEGVGDLLTDNEINSLVAGTKRVIIRLCERYGEGKKNFPNKTLEQCRERQKELILQLENFHLHEDKISSIIRTIFRKGSI